jgi:hypothetical protein
MYHDRLKDWELHTLDGDRYFHLKDYPAACRCFERAVQTLMPWIKRPQNMISGGVRCFALACCNTAYSAIKAEKYHLAEHYYRYCLSQLEWLIAQPECHRLKDVILLESELAYRRYCQFLAERSESDHQEKNKDSLLRGLGRWISKNKLDPMQHEPTPNIRRASLLFY